MHPFLGKVGMLSPCVPPHCTPDHQSCIKYSTNKYQYQYQVQQDCWSQSPIILCATIRDKTMGTGHRTKLLHESQHRVTQNTVGSYVGHSPWQVRRSGTCCLIMSVIHRSASDLFDQHWMTLNCVMAVILRHFTHAHPPRGWDASAYIFGKGKTMQMPPLFANNQNIRGA